MSLIIKPFTSEYTQSTYELFYNTVHKINIQDYSQEQCDIWAPKDKDLNKWYDSLIKNHSFVALDIAGKLVGFSDMNAQGYFDRGFVHKDYQRQGIGQALLDIRIQKAKELSIEKVWANVSITAKPFYLKNNFRIVKSKHRILSGLNFKQFEMELILK